MLLFVDRDRDIHIGSKSCPCCKYSTKYEEIPGPRHSTCSMTGKLVMSGSNGALLLTPEKPRKSYLCPHPG